MLFGIIATLCKKSATLLESATYRIRPSENVKCVDDEARDLHASVMIRKLNSGQYRLYSRKIDARTGKRRNLGTFDTRAAAERHERAVQYFKHGH